MNLKLKENLQKHLSNRKESFMEMTNQFQKMEGLKTSTIVTNKGLDVIEVDDWDDYVNDFAKCLCASLTNKKKSWFSFISLDNSEVQKQKEDEDFCDSLKDLLWKFKYKKQGMEVYSKAQLKYSTGAESRVFTACFFSKKEKGEDETKEITIAYSVVDKGWILEKNHLRLRNEYWESSKENALDSYVEYLALE